MSMMIVCKGCGEGLRVPPGHDGAHILCPACNAVCDVPREAPAWAVQAGPRPPQLQPLEKRDDDSSAEAEAWAVTASPPTQKSRPQASPTDEDDDSPYEVPPNPDEKIPCPKCRGKLTRDAIVCAHCGYHLETGETFERLYKPVDLQWDTGLSLKLRLSIFLSAAALALMATVIASVATGDPITYIMSFLFGFLLQAYVLGTYPRLNLTRTRKGRVYMSRTWRVGFIPLRTIDIRWREFEGVTTRQSGEADFWDLVVFLMLLPCGLIPALLFWMYVIAPGQFDVA